MYCKKSICHSGVLSCKHRTVDPCEELTVARAVQSHKERSATASFRAHINVFIDLPMGHVPRISAVAHCGLPRVQAQLVRV
jgi:hypothetical protein